MAFLPVVRTGNLPSKNKNSSPLRTTEAMTSTPVSTTSDSAMFHPRTNILLLYCHPALPLRYQLRCFRQPFDELFRSYRYNQRRFLCHGGQLLNHISKRYSQGQIELAMYLIRLHDLLYTGKG